MKLSLAWLFSHIKKNPFIDFQPEFEKGRFFERIGATVAEIEHVEKITYPLDKIFFGLVSAVENGCTVTLPELGKSITLPSRSDVAVGNGCLVIKKADDFKFLSLRDLHADKEGLVPGVWVAEDQQAGGWKAGISHFDYILTFDNKALTHRPDLWGHRGFAREIAALYHLELLVDEYIFAQKPIRSFGSSTPAVAGNTIGLENNLPAECKRFAGLSLPQISYIGSFPDMVFRLCAIDAKPINGLVDCTNYVMYDIGQPMHAFDLNTITGDVLKVSHAVPGEKLTLLDGSLVTLSAEDIVITDGKNTLGLAGIMGGASTAVSKKTTALFIESASYAATTIRTSSLRHKIRSESSTRFEKSLDPLYNTQALMRFLHLLDIHDVSYESGQAIMSLGEVPEQRVIEFSQQFIIDRIGATVTADQIYTILHSLGFGVQQKQTSRGVWFAATVPSFRATKDVTIAEDIVEEIARFIGFNNLAMQLPTRVMKPFSIDYIMARRALKRLCAFGFNMHEVSNYAFYDNQFVKKLGLTPQDTASLHEVALPVSENWTHLVSSLVPHLLKNIEQNIHEHDRMAFFEMSTVWNKVEHVSYAGIWYQAGELDFYEYKEKVSQIFKLLGLPVLWRKPVVEIAAWYHPYQSAELVCDDTVIGHAGCVRPDILRTVAAGSAFVFELAIDTLIAFKKDVATFAPLSPFQPLTTDISMLVPFSVSVDILEQALARADARIYSVQLVDYFEKPEWIDQRSITLRYRAVDNEKTFSKQEIERLRASVVQAVQALGVIIR